MSEPIPQCEIDLIMEMIDKLEDRLRWGAVNENGECAYYNPMPPIGLKVVAALRSTVSQFIEKGDKP